MVGDLIQDGQPVVPLPMDLYTEAFARTFVEEEMVMLYGIIYDAERGRPEFTGNDL